jgi:FAD/FMN-containing dehydrogenase
VTAGAVRALRDAIDGPVHLPGDEGYDAARLPWQRRFDPQPALVVEASGPVDVRAAIQAAREHDLPLVVQTTGHGTVRPSDGALLLKTSRMTGVEVDAGRRVARVGGGALWSDVLAAAAPYGLAPLSGSSAGVGVAGYTLGGGAGFLSRVHGYAADNLLSADVVTADGELLTADAEQLPDLFWALRGGGGNFGVVTALEFRLFEVERVYGGMAMYDAERAADTLALYSEWALDEPDESNTAVTVMTLPPVPQVPEPLRGRRLLGLRAFYLGGAEQAEPLLAPLRAAAGEPVMDGLGEMTFPEIAAMLGPAPPPMANQGHFAMFEQVPVAELAAVAANPAVTGFELRHWGGAMARPPADGGPLGFRDVPFSAALMAMAPDRELLAPGAAAVAEAAAVLEPHATGRSFLNFLGDPEQTASAYTPEDYRRLAAIKRDYDPENVFGGNHNIPPAG